MWDSREPVRANWAKSQALLSCTQLNPAASFDEVAVRQHTDHVTGIHIQLYIKVVYDVLEPHTCRRLGGWGRA